MGALSCVSDRSNQIPQACLSSILHPPLPSPFHPALIRLICLHYSSRSSLGNLQPALVNDVFYSIPVQALLEDVLMDSCFQAAQQLPDDLMDLAMVMLYDLQDRKFLPREPMTGEEEGPVEEVRLMEDGLFRFRTKLAASLARFRIKQDLVCIDDILPKSLKEKHQKKHKVPTCAWVNTLKS
ncbi:putative methyltransferase NSUN7, partial [Tachysurus ichikawai]